MVFSSSLSSKGKEGSGACDLQGNKQCKSPNRIIMADQRSFRFRLPWLSAATAPAPPPPRRTVETQQPRPAAQTQPPAQPTTTAIPSQRPPFRPAGIAPPQPAPQATRAEPQPSQPSRAANEPRVASQPASPSHPNQTRAASVPPSPSRGATETRVISQPVSPPRATQTQPVSPTKFPTQAVTQPRAASVPPSPSRTATQGGPPTQSPSRFASRTTGQTSSQTSYPMRRTTQVQPTARAVSQPPSPPKKTQPVIQETSRPPLNVIQPRLSTPREQELKPAATLQPSQEQPPKTQIKSEIVSESQYQTGKETTFKPDRVAAQPTQASAVAPTSVAAPAEKKFEKIEDKKAVEEHVKEGIAQEQVKEEKSNRPVDAEQMQRAVSKLLTAASGSETKTRELVTATFQTEETRPAEQEIFERKKPLTSPKSDEKQIKTVSSTPLKDRERAPLQKEIRDDFLKFAHKLAIGHPKQQVDGKPVSIITVAGENRGASMYVGSESAKKDGSVPIHRGYKVNSSEIPETTTDDGEGSSKEKIPRDHKTKKDQATGTYINSNTQSINDSILFSSSVNERNPGVHLVLSHNSAEPTKSTTEPESVETRKAQVSVTTAENLTYQPTVRRRCLRGLFMEPSDSDPDNADKPRRHGCLYNRGEKSKDKEIGLL